MPQTRVVFYQDADGTCPVLEWLADLKRENPKAFAKCLVRIERLSRTFPPLKTTKPALGASFIQFFDFNVVATA